MTSEQSNEREPQSQRARLIAGLLIAAALTATVIVPIVLGGRQAIVAVLNFSARAYIAIFALIIASWLARALKLKILLARLQARPGFMRIFGISLASDFAFIATPGGLGGYAASIYYLRRAGTSASGAAAITAADQGLDILFFVIMLPVAALLLLSSEGSAHLTHIALALSLAIVALAIVAYAMRRSFGVWLFSANWIIRRWPRLDSRQRALREFALRLQVSMQLLLDGGTLLKIVTFALTVVQQLTRYAILWVALQLLGHEVPFALTFLLQALVLPAAMWTGLPAGGGAAEIGLSASLVSLVPVEKIATALLLWRAATLYVCLLAGLIAIGLLARVTPLNVAATEH